MSQTVIEVAKACKELGKPVIDTACGLINSLLGKPCEIAGEMISDELYRWQWERRITILDKADQKIKKRGSVPEVLPKGFFLTFLESAGQVEPNKLQELWANLLAKSLEDDVHQHPAFIQVLKQLSIAEALVIAVLGERPFRFIRKLTVVKQDAATAPLTTEEFETQPSIPLEQKAVMVALSYLSELGLITVRIENDHDRGHYLIKTETAIVAFTTFGAAFFEACVSEGESKPRPVVDNWTIMSQIHNSAKQAGRVAADAAKAAQEGLRFS